jgi:CheY-like chemotaxis protein
LIEAPFHAVTGSAGRSLDDTFVLEVRVAKPRAPSLYLTGSGEAYRRTIGGIKKLSGAELFTAIATPLQTKVAQPDQALLVARFPALYKRATLVEPIIRGRRVLWVDDHPSNNFYERLALAQMGVSVNVATSTDEGLRSATLLRPDVIVSDMARDDENDAGLKLLSAVRLQGIKVPLIYYVGEVVDSRGVPARAFGIADRPDDVLHLILDALERGAG